MNNLLKNSKDVAEKLEKKTCVLIFSWQRHLPFLKACLEQIRKLDLFTILAWDKGDLPTKQMLNLIDLFVMKHSSSSGVVNSWMWHIKYTLPIVDEFDFDFVYSMSGDCYLEKPENFNQLYKLLKDKDIISYWHDKNRIGTMAWMCRMPIYKKIMDYIWNNWDEKLVGGMAECKVRNAANKIEGVTLINTMQAYFEFKLPPDGDPTDGRGRGVFGEILGMRHLQWEYMQRNKQNMMPLESELIDLSFV